MPIGKWSDYNALLSRSYNNSKQKASIKIDKNIPALCDKNIKISESVINTPSTTWLDLI